MSLLFPSLQGFSPVSILVPGALSLHTQDRPLRALSLALVCVFPLRLVIVVSLPLPRMRAGVGKRPRCVLGWSLVLRASLGRMAED